MEMISFFLFYSSRILMRICWPEGGRRRALVKMSLGNLGHEPHLGLEKTHPLFHFTSLLTLDGCFQLLVAHDIKRTLSTNVIFSLIFKSLSSCLKFAAQLIRASLVKAKD
ncbi:hypothetical protein AVEN_56968-1 [Araneus ventricosus]|uniref:Uncharacterized protein n=1 Tax=Araneus ventricosus TaxID=182803 RepID=A0A4Y2T6W6_ARAVE|nr:hypothetical protein AVEN_34466-1 [Araneus ventricosus]GBN96365.1 hypothetical protein AVEN_56968-1 [Araneus ventricosus]